ncbi:hypothetical protein QFC19_004010 [Naganishia cerealis]|uniref:Uncharacterized protein n=1 Tax=Naganishia cerealis TaxID=610337 RepID=A0ACC2VYS2_9TREE|nr:hypothetical protein QFC19_004010 [Naganishia cerealis]
MEEQLDEWIAFLKDYAEGGVTAAAIPVAPAFLSNASPQGKPSGDLRHFTLDSPVYRSTSITPDVARRVRDYAIAHRFLPPPRHPMEHLREAIIHDYDLHGSEQVQSIQSTLNVIQAFYGGVVAFTLFEKETQVLQAVSGPQDLLEALDLYQGKRIIPETSLCGHAALSTGAIFIPDFQNDWRYSRNPFASDMSASARDYIHTQVSLSGYVGVPVTLLLDPSSAIDSSVVPIGVINLLITDPEAAARVREPGHTMVLSEVARMLQTQLRATWDRNRLSKDAQMRRSISQFIEQTLARPCGRRIANEVKARPGESDDLKDFAKLACVQIRAVLSEADIAMIVDLRTTSCNKFSPLSILAFDGASSTVSEMEENLARSSSSEAVHMFLEGHRRTCSDAEELPSTFSSNIPGLECLLPAATKSHLIVPFTSTEAQMSSSTEEQYVFLIVVASARPSHHFGSMDLNYVKSMGGILRAHWLQSRVVEADAAKTRFLSSISHELRTPLHCIVNGLGLLQEAMTRRQSIQCEEYLHLINQSSTLLEQILNDVLDYGTITQTTTKQQLVQNEEFDLAQAVILAVQTSLPRMHPHIKGERDVEVLIEYEDRDWTVKSDATAFKRILVNGFTNAMKATQAGKIVVRLETMSDSRGIVCRIIDTGKGVSADIADKVFLPFVKGDPWIPGAGLGLNITQGLVSRMKGTVQLIPNRDCGMTFQVEVPIELRSRSDYDSSAAPLALVRPLIQRNMTLTEHTIVPSGRIVSTLLRVNSEFSSGDLASRAGSSTGSDHSDGLPRTPDLAPVAEAYAMNDLPCRLRVLVADDNEIGRKIAIRAIDNSHTDIVEADNGFKAFEIFKTFAPHLIFTDIGMPIWDGIKSSKEMRAFEAQTGRRRARIYAVTGLGSADPRLAEDGLQGTAQLDGWLTKGKHGFEHFRKIVRETLTEMQQEARSSLRILAA